MMTLAAVALLRAVLLVALAAAVQGAGQEGNSRLGAFIDRLNPAIDPVTLEDQKLVDEYLPKDEPDPASKCNDKRVFYIYLRGSKQPMPWGTIHRGGKQIAASMNKKYGEDAVFTAFDYKANLLPNLRPNGVDKKDAQNLVDLMNDVAAKCKQVKIVVVGYSQGAALVHYALEIAGLTKEQRRKAAQDAEEGAGEVHTKRGLKHGLRGDDNDDDDDGGGGELIDQGAFSEEATEKETQGADKMRPLTAEAKERIAAVFLYGDTKKWKHKVKKGPYKGQYKVTGMDGSKSLIFCRPSDWWCNTPLVFIPLNLAHSDYKQGVVAGIEWLLKMTDGALGERKVDPVAENREVMQRVGTKPGLN